MKKSEIVSKIYHKTGIDKSDISQSIEAFMEEIKTSLVDGENVYLRGFGSFIVKKRAGKLGRNISKNIPVNIPPHNIPAFKPAKVFLENVKEKVLVK